MESCINLRHKKARSKIFRIKRKIKYNPSKESENDLELEKEGNITDFLLNSEAEKAGPRFLNGKLVPYSVIGSTEAFISRSQKILPAKFGKRNSSVLFLKFQRKESAADPKIIGMKKFNEVISRLDRIKKNEAQEERKKIKKIIHNSKDPIYLSENSVYYKTTQASLQKRGPTSSFDLNRSKYLPSLDSYSQPLTTSSKNFTYEGEFSKFHWYMNLRGNKEKERLNAFIRVGSEFNGLYLKISKPNPVFNVKAQKKLDKNLSLEITGINKLNLETEALKKVGYECLSLDLLEKNSKLPEEIIEECYE